MNKLMLFPISVMVICYIILFIYTSGGFGSEYALDDSNIQDFGYTLDLGGLGNIHFGLGLFSFGDQTIDFTSITGIVGTIAGLGCILALLGLKVGASGTTNSKALYIAIVYSTIWAIFAVMLMGFFYQMGEIGEMLLWGLTLMYGIGAMFELVGSADSSGF